MKPAKSFKIFVIKDFKAFYYILKRHTADKIGRHPTEPYTNRVHLNVQVT